MTPEPLRLNPDGTLPGMKEMARKLRAKAGLPPDPAPYGADLPRGIDTLTMVGALSPEQQVYTIHGVIDPYLEALDAANAEVLARRAQCAALIDRCTEHEMVIGALEDERDALRKVVERVVTLCHHYEDRKKEWDARYVAHRIRDEVAHILPAPTEPSNLYPRARGAVAPTTTPQAPGGSGVNTGEVGRG